MNILIVEDEPIAAAHLQELVGELKPDVRVIGVDATVHGAVRRIDNSSIDLIFMDVQLADGLCFDIFDVVTPVCPVVFCTAFDDYAVRAFKANGIDYLLKPVRARDVSQAFEKYELLRRSYEHEPFARIVSDLARSAGPKKRFLLRVANRLISNAVEQIAWFEARDKGVVLHDHGGRHYYTDSPLRQLEDCLGTDRFFRINRQFLIAWEAIDEIRIEDNRYQVRLKRRPGDAFVSRDRSVQFRRWLDR